MVIWDYLRFKLPLIHSYSLVTQLAILGVLLILSLSHRPARFVIAGLILAYFAYNILSYIWAPVYAVLSFIIGWGWTIFKGVAIFGFYVHFFKIGLAEGFSMIEGMVTGWKHAREEREHEASEERRRKRYEEPEET